MYMKWKFIGTFSGFGAQDSLLVVSRGWMNGKEKANYFAVWGLGSGV